MRGRLILILFLIGLLASCKDDEQPLPAELSSSNGVLIINEGTFQWGNATLGLYDSDSNSYTDQVFKRVNKVPIGDVFFSVTQMDDELWCVINNSGKIRVLDAQTFKQKFEVDGFISPRYACDGQNGKVYVTDLYANGVYVVDKVGQKIESKISITGWTEHIMLAGERLYVTNQERPFLFLVDPANNTVTDSLEIADFPNSMVRANNATILVLCEQKLGSTAPSEMILIDPKARQVSDRYAFGASENPVMMRKDESTGMVFYLDSGIRVLNGFDLRPLSKVADLSYLPYGFGIDPKGDFYVSDAGNFVDPSVVHRYDRSGKEVNSFTAGVNSNGFVFR